MPDPAANFPTTIDPLDSCVVRRKVRLLRVLLLGNRPVNIFRDDEQRGHHLGKGELSESQSAKQGDLLNRGRPSLKWCHTRALIPIRASMTERHARRLP